jgi:hypothetical protein
MIENKRNLGKCDVPEEHKKLFLHSGCCGGHWELTYQNGKYHIECEECGRPFTGIKITGPLRSQEECECEICKKREKGLIN